MEQLTPMMRQYKEIKRQYEDTILFFRLGDFYEMFFEDAELASKELEITLTAREAGNNNKAPMCGFPYHAAQTYLFRLLKKGYKVAICEQVSAPQQGDKEIVKREVVKVITPGTVVDEAFLEMGTNNYLVSLYNSNGKVGLAYTDFSTGEFCTTEFVLNDTNLKTELLRLSPVEIIYNGNLSKEKFNWLNKNTGALLTIVPDSYFSLSKAEVSLVNYFATNSLDILGVSHFKEGIKAAGAILVYLQNTQKDHIKHLQKITPYYSDSFMVLDNATRRNLELMATIKEQKERGSLIWVIDKTVTALGSRMLRRWLNQPLKEIEAIVERQQGVTELVKSYTTTVKLRELLKKIYDLERLVGKLNTGNATPLDLLALKLSFQVIPELKSFLSDFSGTVHKLNEQLDELQDITELIEQGINPAATNSTRLGEIIRDGFHWEIDQLRQITRDSKQWLINLEAKERERTGIKSLKIGYNKVFGYYLEVTNANLSLIPQDYQRKQTLANAERYVIDELKEFEEKILNAEDKLTRLEQEIFLQIKQQIIKSNNRIQITGAAIAKIDVLANLAYVAINNNYTKPDINDSADIILFKARHPVIEQIQQTDFVTNDIYLNNNREMIHIVTGPNMAGKSTLARTVALITLLAQIGSYIPAASGKIGVVDRIFARVGASDDLTTGQSTFMVEMNEVANIITHATSKSLIILDEIGRGTSTFDGLSIAWAITEYLHNKVKAKTIFTTHFHELTALSDSLCGVKNYNVMVKEYQDTVTFLYKIVPGCANKSYGIQVAKLAGLPKQLLDTAKQILKGLEEASSITAQIGNEHESMLLLSKDIPEQVIPYLLKDIFTEIKDLNIYEMNPLAALNYLAELQKRFSKLGSDLLNEK